VNQTSVQRREFLKTAAAGMLAVCVPRALPAQTRLSDKLTVLDAGGVNVLAFNASDGLVLVDSGVPKTGDRLMAALNGIAPGAKVSTVINTHYHLDHTGNNEMFASAGAKVVAQRRTKEWMSVDYWVPQEERWEKARPKGAWPTETFTEAGSLKAGGEQIDYGYLILAHTSGDAYVYFRNANVLAVGDVASPVLDPSFDWYTGAWIGARVDAMDKLLKLVNDQTKILPGCGTVMTKAEFKAERDMMEELRARLFTTVREGDSPQDMLEAGVLKGLPRTWKDPNKFLYAAAKGLWAHHDKLDPNVV
jgi:glyoxylase-like metal-dependent hydrolase (beta-lactamase superfamily II)